MILIIGFISAELKITEIESNPTGTDSGDEWVEIFSSSQIDLEGYYLENNDEDIYYFNASFQSYYVIELNGQWLDNSDEKVFLKNELGETIDEGEVFEDSENDDRTWQYCDGNWVFADESKGSANDCSGDEDEEDLEDTEDGPSIVLSWDKDEIINNKEFEIKVKVRDLEDEKYDVKIWIEEKGEIISERYDEEKEEWRSGNYYIDDLFDEEGDSSIYVRIRLKEDYKDFEGKSEVFARLRKGSSTIDSFEDEIRILKGEENLDEEGDQDIEVISYYEDDNEAIKLGAEKGEEENSIIYKSKNEYIKEAAIYGFALLCIMIIVVLIIKRIKWQKKSKQIL